MIRAGAAYGLLVLLLALPGYSGSPQSSESDEQPEFYFTRLMYRDVRGRGGSGSGRPPDGGCVGSAIFSGGIGNGGFGHGFGSGAWMTDTWNADCKHMWGDSANDERPIEKA